MNVKESILNTFMVMRTYKMRSILTMLGIIIGISAVIIINSIGKGHVCLIQDIFSKLGKNVVKLKRDSNLNDQRYRYIDFSMKDVKALRKNPNIKYVSVEESPNIVIVAPDIKNISFKSRPVACAVNNSYFDIFGMPFIAGRAFSENDKNKFAVLDNEFATALFGSSENALGKKVTFHTIWYWNRINSIIQNYTVIGVVDNPLKELNKINGNGEGLYIYVPANQFADITGKNTFSECIFDAVSGVNPDLTAKSSIKQISQIEKAPKDIFTYEKLNDFKDSTSETLGKTNLFVNFVSAISLFVGGIGVMVIMLVTVTERTREIGIRKAIGAKNKDIMIQFLLESITLTVTGGIIGIVVGCIGSFLAGSFTDIPPVIDYRTIIFAVIVTILIGVIFGIYPAKKASEKNPVEALRYE